MREAGVLALALSLMISAVSGSSVYAMEESPSKGTGSTFTPAENGTPPPSSPASVPQTGNMVEPMALPAETEKSGTSDAPPPEELVKQKTNGTKPRFALSLSGGGARGAAHVGVLKVLEAEGLRPDFIAGSSAGAMIGGLFAAGVPAAKIEELVLSPKFKKAFFPRPEYIQSALYIPRYALMRAVGMKPLIGLYSGKSLSKYMRKHLPPGVENIEDTKIPFAATSVNLEDTKTVWITKGSLAEAIRASSTVPFVYRPKQLDDGSALVDGGMRANLPTEAGQAAGAPIVIGVKLHSYLEKVGKEKFDTLWEYGDRLTSILMAEIESKTMKDADILIEPEVEYMNIYSFKRDKLVKAIAAGESAARDALPKIREMMQTRTAQVEGGNVQ